ncbi:homocysteine S-methyltransferase family protein [Bradyrhizobium sp. STM 3557]|uniref:homocysteine S-methyltransferase family protein n=1 Tax=Bradyrhizobium sp. STM 3557 TaxID=578920 RepID=UPI00388D4336
MAKYRHDLPQRRGGIFLTDGGMETTLIFHHGLELPHFAAFVLLDSVDGREHLKRCYESYLAIAQANRTGFVLDSPTWRANPDWGTKLGYDADALKSINTRSIEYLNELRSSWERPNMPIVINGVIGPRGDGYKSGNMDASEAEAYHAPQIAAFAEAGADMVTAFTLNGIDEAVGIVRAAKAAKSIPVAISFTVEIDGRLVKGETLREAIETVDRTTRYGPEYFMINCAHPSHFEGALNAGEKWSERIQGVRANASTKSHHELDESETLDSGDPVDLGRRYADLRRSFPSLRILGGCCGTDHRHVAAICEACI